MALNKKTTCFIRVDRKTIGKVKRKIKNINYTIGSFYDEAVEEKLSRIKAEKALPKPVSINNSVDHRNAC